MSLTSRIALLSMLLIGASTLAASPAAAQATLEVTSEADVEHCPATGTVFQTRCVMHVVSDSPTELREHLFGVEFQVTTCDTEFNLRWTENGLQAWATEPVMTGAGCARRPCTNAMGVAASWTFGAIEDLDGTEDLSLAMCYERVSDGEGDRLCTPEIGFTNIAASDHEYEFEANDLPGGGDPRCEVTGHWLSEFSQTESTVEVVHVSP